jgi:hypothetical protein
MHDRLSMGAVATLCSIVAIPLSWLHPMLPFALWTLTRRLALQPVLNRHRLR